MQELQLGDWEVSVDLDKRILRVKGANNASYPLMNGVLILYKQKGKDACFSRFYDENIMKLLEKYSIDDVVIENPNQSYDFSNDTVICSDGKVSAITVEKRAKVMNASYVLEYVKRAKGKGENLLAQNPTSARSLAKKPKGYKCILHTVDGGTTLENILDGKQRRDD